MSGSVTIPRPKRWDVPFALEGDLVCQMTDDDVGRLLAEEPFCVLDADGFRKSLPLSEILKNDARVVPFDTGDIVVRRGDWGNTAFFVLSGSVRVELEPPKSAMPPSMLGRGEHDRMNLFQAVAQLWRNSRLPEVRHHPGRLDDRVGTRRTGDGTRLYLQDVPQVLNQYHTVTLETGQWFGELAALGRTPRTATIFADSPCELLEIRWQGLRDIMRYDRHGGLKRYIEDVFRDRALSTFLRAEPLFRNLDDDQMDRLVREAEFETFGNYDSHQPFKELAKQGAELNLANEPFVAREGEYPNGVVLIRSGLARISERYHNGYRTVGYLMPGQSYGFQEIAAGWKQESASPLRYSLTAIGYLNVVVIPTVLVEELLLESGIAPPGSESSLREKPVEEDIRQLDSHLVDFLVDNRYVQGTATMLIDLDRCTRCDDCVRACAMTHDGNPRFIRHGPVHGRFMMANACLHCADPVCMIDCPTGAIHRNQREGQIVISDETCIGCAQCASNCPYDAIRMVEIRDSQGQFVVDEKNRRPLTQATKCDLCIDQPGGPACQQACAHEALQRVDMRHFETLNSSFRP